MAEKKTTPLHAAFSFTSQEKRYILIICTLFLLGIIARWLFLNNRRPTPYEPVGIEQAQAEEQN